MAQKTITRDYEALFLFGTAATANVDEAMSTVRSFIEKHGGTIHVLKRWDDRKLAYEVQKQGRGLYILAFFNAPTPAVAQIERDVRLSETVMRVLITDASHLTVEEFEAMEPQRPEPKPERTEGDFGGGYGGGFGGGGGRGRRGEDFAMADQEDSRAS